MPARRELIDNVDGTHTVPLTRGYNAIIDSADAARVGQHSWCALPMVKSDTVYAQTKIDGRTVTLHRFVLELLGLPGLVDHRNGNGLDNRRSNLRVCTIYENNQNVGRRKTNSSGFKGVIWSHRDNGWRSGIRANGTYTRLGIFATAEEAAAAYQEAAHRLHGEFANCGELAPPPVRAYDPKQLLTLAEAAAYVRRTPQALRTACSRGQLRPDGKGARGTHLFFARTVLVFATGNSTGYAVGRQDAAGKMVDNDAKREAAADALPGRVSRGRDRVPDKRKNQVSQDGTRARDRSRAQPDNHTKGVQRSGSSNGSRSTPAHTGGRSARARAPVDLLRHLDSA